MAAIILNSHLKVDPELKQIWAWSPQIPNPENIFCLVDIETGSLLTGALQPLGFRLTEDELNQARRLLQMEPISKEAAQELEFVSAELKKGRK